MSSQHGFPPPADGPSNQGLFNPGFFNHSLFLRRMLAETTIAPVNWGFLNIFLLAGLLLGARVNPLWGQTNEPNARIRSIILQSRHMGAHGLGYNDRSLTELSRKLASADVPELLTLLKDRSLSVGVQFALASQCGAGIAQVREALKQHRMDFSDASDVMDLVAGFAGCPSAARAEARTAKKEIEQLQEDEQARIAEESRRKAEDDARIQANSIKMIDPVRARDLTREERVEVYQRSLKAMGLNDKGPLTPAQKQMVDRMYRTMVLGEGGAPPRQ